MNAINASLQKRDVRVLYAKCPNPDLEEHWILVDFDTKPNGAAQCLRCGPNANIEIDQPWKEGRVSHGEQDAGYTITKPDPDNS
jgi:hypothetical protein